MTREQVKTETGKIVEDVITNGNVQDFVTRFNIEHDVEQEKTVKPSSDT